MRKTFLLLLLCIAALRISAQQYFPMPDSNAVWKEFFNTFPSPNPVFTDHYLDGDTLINSVSYNKVYRDLVSVQHTYVGGIRNDSASKKVYFFDRDSITETLLYDFDLSVGQVFPMTYFNTVNYVPDTVYAIDSVWVGSSWRKRYRTYDWKYAIIEGIGSSGGLFFYDPMPYWVQRLNCFYLDGQPIWSPFSCGSPLDVHTSIEPGANLAVYPSPADEFLTLTFDAQEEYFQFELFTTSGRLVLSQSCRSAQTNTISVAGIESGLYFVSVKTAEGVCQVQKIIVE